MEAIDEVDSNDADQLAFLEHVDAILLGATTYRLFATTGRWPTPRSSGGRADHRLPKFVVSNTLDSAPWGDGEIEVLRAIGIESVAALKERSRASSCGAASRSPTRCFEAGLVDELRLRVVPRADRRRPVVHPRGTRPAPARARPHGVAPERARRVTYRVR
jgi:hypothetical protein